MTDANKGTERFIGAAIEVHRRTGAGLLESAYQRCLEREFQLQGIDYQKEPELPILSKGLQLDCGYRLDFVVARQVVVEVKSVQTIEPIHEPQLLTYLRLGGWKIGLLINFNAPLSIYGVRRKGLGL